MWRVSERARERPPRREYRPEDRREQEAPGEQRDRVAAADDVLGEQDVGRVRDRPGEREQHAGRRERRPAAEQVHDQRQPEQRQRERGPDPPPHRILVDEARPERDEQRREVLDQQRDPDREAVDRQEVEPLHERQTDEAEREQVRQLAPRQPQAPGRDRGDDHDQPDRCAERPHLREPLRREARREDRLRDRAVHAPEHRRRRCHQIAEPRAPNAGRLDWEGGLAHGPPTLPTSTLVRTGRSSAWSERRLWEAEAVGSNPTVPIWRGPGV